MNAGKRTLGHVFEGTLRLAVPLFQRPYSWKEDPNWELLVWPTDSDRNRFQETMTAEAVKKM